MKPIKRHGQKKKTNFSWVCSKRIALVGNKSLKGFQEEPPKCVTVGIGELRVDPRSNGVEAKMQR